MIFMNDNCMLSVGGKTKSREQKFDFFIISIKKSNFNEVGWNIIKP